MRARSRRPLWALLVALVIPGWALAGFPSNSQVIGSGTSIFVRNSETIDTKQAADGQVFSAVVERDVADERGTVAIPKGSEALLAVRKNSDGKVFLFLDSVTANGKHYRVESGRLNEKTNGKQGVGKNGRTARMVGGGAVLGTLLGAIAGGGKGAAIGAISGATAGGLVQEITKGKPARNPAETMLHFRLDQPLRLETSA